MPPVEEYGVVGREMRGAERRRSRCDAAMSRSSSCAITTLSRQRMMRETRARRETDDILHVLLPPILPTDIPDLPPDPPLSLKQPPLLLHPPIPSPLIVPPLQPLLEVPSRPDVPQLFPRSTGFERCFSDSWVLATPLGERAGAEGVRGSEGRVFHVHSCRTTRDEG